MGGEPQTAWSQSFRGRPEKMEDLRSLIFLLTGGKAQWISREGFLEMAGNCFHLYFFCLQQQPGSSQRLGKNRGAMARRTATGTGGFFLLHAVSVAFWLYPWAVSQTTAGPSEVSLPHYFSGWAGRCKVKTLVNYCKHRFVSWPTISTFTWGVFFMVGTKAYTKNLIA